MPPKENKAAICRTRGKVTSNEGDDMKDLASARRRYHNPLYKDYATFLKTSEETDGEYTLIEFEVGPGDGPLPHYHRSYDEHFEVIEGTLEVLVGEEIRTLNSGEKAVARRIRW
jgi:mannose-6-phosphate isomerase-like protein (cupin superfamily)